MGLLGLACSLLLAVAAVMNVYLSSRDEPPLELSGLTLRARFQATYRRHPRGRGVQLACAVLGLLLYLSYAVVQFL